ncbi:DENN domain-containing protein 5B [Senna tora]|uniref:DENN domain-containing protein 5B n=1 Tax=Senna tora TaxID=362788 RepID=A0A834W073_9FABA|nr:DENN domain-containing protein 5B [Senna tora]
MSGEATRAAGEALNTVYSNVSSVPPMEVQGHRRTQSEDVIAGHRRTNSFQKLKSHVQKAWRWGGRSREEGLSNFNPEVMANQKRQWYQLHSKIMDCVNYKEPTSLFEHFVIVGLHSDANLDVVEAAFVERKKWEKQMAKSEFVDFKMMQQQGPTAPTLEPQLLFKYPPGKRLPMRKKDLASFCFPEGVKWVYDVYWLPTVAWVLERTPSLSELNELVYGQAADNATLYGVCLHVPEIVQRPPGILGISSPLSPASAACSRFLVSAPRCYCLLTRVPFFELHFEMLNSLTAQDRLNRITQFVNEMSLTGSITLRPKPDHQMSQHVGSPERESFSDWMACAIPVDGAAAITAAAAGIATDTQIPHFSPKWDPQSPESATASESSDFFLVDRDSRKNLQDHDDCTFEIQETQTESTERMYENYENGHISPDFGTPLSSRSSIQERFGNSELFFSPVRSMASDDEDDLFANAERDYGDEFLMQWARETKNDLLQIVCKYHALPLPLRGSEFIFHPLEHLQAIGYRRSSVAALGFRENYFNRFEPAQVNAKLAAAEEALALSIWTTATTCRVLSLDSVLTVVAGMLLEKQVVLVCPNLGVLSAAVLSLIPMIRPFQWQSLFLPVLPRRMFDFLDAPVPYIVGIQHKPADLKIKTTNLIYLNVLKDQVNKCHLPKLPQHKELVSRLAPIHARFSRSSSIAKRHPVYRCNEVQADAAHQFLNVMYNYLESLCSDLRSHTITSVESNNDRVSLLLKDSFIDSFPARDRPFIKLFVDTQLFTVLSDSRLSSFENGYDIIY